MQHVNSLFLLGFSFILVIFFSQIDLINGTTVILANIIYFSLLFYFLRFEGISTLTLVLITGYLYLFSGYIDIHFFGNQRDISIEGTIIYLQVGLFFVGFLCFFQKILSSNQAQFSNVKNLEAPFEFKILICLLLIYLFYMGVTSIGIAFFQSRTDNYESRGGILTILRILLSICFIWLIAKYNYKKDMKFIVLAIGAFFIFEIVFLGDRRILLSTMACVFLAFYNDGLVKKRHIVALIFLTLFLLFFSWIRNAPPETWLELFSSRGSNLGVFSPMNLEFSGASIVASKFYDYYGIYITDNTFTGALTNVLPGSIYPLRDVPPAVKFVQEFYPAVYSVGGTYAYSIVVDATGNFGILGVIIYPLFICLYLKYCYGLKNNRLAVLYSVYLLIFVWRMDLFSIFKIASLIIIMHLFLCAVAKLSRKL